MINLLTIFVLDMKKKIDCLQNEESVIQQQRNQYEKKIVNLEQELQVIRQ